MRRLLASIIALVLPAALAILPQARILADTTVFSDTFTGTTTSLQGTTPTVGSAWVLDEDTTGAATTARRNTIGYQDFSATTASTMSFRLNYQAPGTSTFTDGYVEGTMTQINDSTIDDFYWFRIRRTAATTYLGCGWYAAAVATDSYCFKVVSGTYTQLASGDCGAIDNSVMRVTVTGDTITLTKDGSACSTPVSGTGANAVTGPGDGGFGMGGLRNASDDVTGTAQPNMDNFSAVKQDAATGPPAGTFHLFGLGK